MKKMCLFWVDRNLTLASVSYLATLLWRKDDEDYFFPKLRVRIKDNNNLPHGKFHPFLFPFSSTFSDLTFSSYALYMYLCYVTCHAQWAWVTYDFYMMIIWTFAEERNMYIMCIVWCDFHIQFWLVTTIHQSNEFVLKIRWNPDFLNLYGKQKLVPKSGVKLHYSTKEGKQLLVQVIWRFEKLRVQDIRIPM